MLGGEIPGKVRFRLFFERLFVGRDCDGDGVD